MGNEGHPKKRMPSDILTRTRGRDSTHGPCVLSTPLRLAALSVELSIAPVLSRRETAMSLLTRTKIRPASMWLALALACPNLGSAADDGSYRRSQEAARQAQEASNRAAANAAACGRCCRSTSSRRTGSCAKGSSRQQSRPAIRGGADQKRPHRASVKQML